MITGTLIVCGAVSTSFYIVIEGIKSIFHVDEYLTQSYSLKEWCQNK